MITRESLREVLREEFLRARGEISLWDIVIRGDPTDSSGKWSLDVLVGEMVDAALPEEKKAVELAAPDVVVAPEPEITGEPVATEPKPPRRTRRTYVRRKTTD